MSSRNLACVSCILGLPRACGAKHPRRASHCEKLALPKPLALHSVPFVRPPTSWPLMAAAGMNKASFHAAGALDAPALRPLAAMARESSSRVEYGIDEQRCAHLSACEQNVPRRSQFRTFRVASAFRDFDRLRYHGCCRCRWQLPARPRTAECRGDAAAGVRWRAIVKDASEDVRCCIAG